MRGFVYPPAGGDERAVEQARQRRMPAEEADGYKEKLIKYVPAEVLAFFVPVAAFVGSGEDGWLIAIFIVGVIGTLGILRRNNLQVPVDQRAPWWNYVLAVAAFAAWALATSAATAEVVGLDQKAVGLILAIAAFLIPALDFWGAEQKTA
jgi:hypothetical protein